MYIENITKRGTCDIISDISLFMAFKTFDTLEISKDSVFSDYFVNQLCRSLHSSSKYTSTNQCTSTATIEPFADFFLLHLITQLTGKYRI